MIQSVIFDIGKVLVQFSFEEFRSYLLVHGAQINSTEEFIRETKLELHETGALSSAEFLAGIQALLTTAAPEEELVQRWKQIFSPDEQMLSLARSLESKLQVGLLSNTSPLHWEYLCEAYGLADIGEGAVTSFDAGAMKPAAQIYQHAEEQFQLRPEHSVFIDDIEENIEGVRARGWKGIVHRSFEETLDALKELGVEV